MGTSISPGSLKRGGRTQARTFLEASLRRAGALGSSPAAWDPSGLIALAEWLVVPSPVMMAGPWLTKAMSSPCSLSTLASSSANAFRADAGARLWVMEEAQDAVPDTPEAEDADEEKGEETGIMNELSCCPAVVALPRPPSPPPR